jgi:hypothetical protein
VFGSNHFDAWRLDAIPVGFDRLAIGAALPELWALPLSERKRPVEATLWQG